MFLFSGKFIEKIEKAVKLHGLLFGKEVCTLFLSDEKEPKIGAA